MAYYSRYKRRFTNSQIIIKLHPIIRTTGRETSENQMKILDYFPLSTEFAIFKEGAQFHPLSMRAKDAEDVTVYMMILARSGHRDMEVMTNPVWLDN